MPAKPYPNARILIVDDDKPTRMVLRAVLVRQGYQVVEACNGREGLEQVAAHRPDLILMDVMMPELDGYAACAQIRLADGDESLPIVMLTAADDVQSIEAAFNAGATDFITKPINWALLSERVRYALRTGTLNREVRRSRLRELAVRRIAGLAYWQWRLDDDMFEWSDEVITALGLAPQALEHLTGLLQQVHADDRKRLHLALERARDTGARLDLECRMLSTTGERVVRLVGERGQQGEDQNVLFGVVQDLTDSRRAQELVDYLALHDETTGLPNRRLFIRQVREHLQQMASGGRQVLLVGLIDLSRFARFNDTLGEAVADKLLGFVAQALKSLVDAGLQSNVARVGGDEFAVYIEASDEASAAQRFRVMLDALAKPFQVDGHEIFLALTAGYAVYPDHGVDADQLLNQAQEAQRTARRQGRHWMRCESHGGDSESHRAALALERDLYKALENGEFFLMYQPQMGFHNGRIVGAEALIRWRHPRLGVVPPVQFIPVLEETGLIGEVGTWVLQEACRQAAAWSRQGLDLRVGVNLSPRQFLSPDLMATVLQAAEAAQVPPRLIELEITESLAMQDVGHAIRLLNGFRERGFTIAIDDFGIGHSSLEYLLRFPVDVIKIDRAFVTNVTGTRADRAIVRAVVVLAQALDQSVIAEGVETQRQCDFLEALGVNEVQGYLIGKPMLPDELAAMARSYHRPA